MAHYWRSIVSIRDGGLIWETGELTTVTVS